VPEPDVLTIHEFVTQLRVGLETAYTLAQNGEVPGFKVGGQRRFRRRDVEARIDERTRMVQDKGGAR
jgi:excisionase family DNA binding protein